MRSEFKLSKEPTIQTRSSPERRTHLAFASGLLAMALTAALPAQTPSQASVQADIPSLATLTLDAVQNEIKLIHYDQSYLRYRIHTRDQKGDQISDVI